LKKQLFPSLLVLPFLLGTYFSEAQMITGVWKGRMGRQKVEIKIIQKGDSLTGTSYYFESANNYRRYSIRGYFNPSTNAAVWWDDQLIEEKTGKLSLVTPGKTPLLSEADFNCPGSGRMMLDGKLTERDDDQVPKGEVHLNKTGDSSFPDEWDFVIENFTVGANDPDIIDSVALVSFQPPPVSTLPIPREEPVIKSNPPPARSIPKTPVETKKTEPSLPVAIAEKPVPIEEKFKTREKIFIREIPVTGDSIELRFYDNAEIDGDSISLFLNDRMIFQHIRLAAAPYIIKLSVSELRSSNELTMVAENLGTIPPNTSYMVAIVDNKRYDAYLSSSEGSSAMIRLTRQ
jgi:hypothetical protein